MTNTENQKPKDQKPIINKGTRRLLSEHAAVR